jgi:hypothetical protein
MSFCLFLQVLCYEDNRLLKLFSDIVKLMYNGDLVGEDTIQHWYKKGSHPKGRNVFLKVRKCDEHVRNLGKIVRCWWKSVRSVMTVRDQ